MALPQEPVTLSVEQIAELNRQLSAMRHDVSNHISVIVAALELIRYQPQVTERMLSMFRPRAAVAKKED